MTPTQIDAASQGASDTVGMARPDDGSWYAVGRAIFQAPRSRKASDGTETITMGFKVAELDEWISEEAAAKIAAVWNAHDDLTAAVQPFAALFRTGFFGAKDHELFYDQGTGKSLRISDFRRAADVLARLDEAAARAGGGE